MLIPQCPEHRSDQIKGDNLFLGVLFVLKHFFAKKVEGAVVIMPFDFRSHLRPNIEGSVAPNEEMIHVFIVFLTKDTPVGV